ncbi:MAG: T9SS type A sorting domain-containing protein [Candidatus Marinimicrobia bacterium]|nr:T9SS type A sorting domain-containing protein [Candidatus Neomarinimicrobiota bacterium]
MKQLFYLGIFISGIIVGQVDKSMDFCSRQNSLAKWLSVENSLTENQERIDVTFYDLFFKIYPEDESINGRTIVHATVKDSGLTAIDLDLKDGYVIDSVLVNGQSADYTYSSDLLSIQLAMVEPPDIGTEFEAIIGYSGDPQSYDFGSFSFDSHQGENLIWTLSEPYGARGWWPCKDDPSDKADSVNIVVNVPDHLIVASNGSLISEETNPHGRKTYSWHESYPMATYLVSLAIYPYQYWEDTYINADGDSLPLTYYVFPDHYGSLYENYLETKDMMGAFEESFGPYPFFGEKYGHAEFGWGGGMEHQTLSSMGGWSDWLIAHELAHQWWGDMITCADFHHIWLNEGFARYGEALWAEYDEGIDAYHTYWANHAFYGGGTVFVENATSVSEIFNGQLTYNKAGWVVHMLRHVVGDDVFFDMLKAYANNDSLKYASATTEDFRDVCEDFTGLDLHDFFNQWIYGERYPRYQVLYDTSPENAVSIQVNQIQSWQLFHMPVDIRITTTDSVYNYFVDQMGESTLYIFDIPDSEPILNVELDPDNWILKSVEVLEIGQEPPLPGVFSLDSPYPNPFNGRVNIPFAIGHDSDLTFSIQNIMGQTVWKKNAFYPIGNHILNWQGRRGDGTDLPSGLYFFTIQSPEKSLRQKILYLK